MDEFVEDIFADLDNDNNNPSTVHMRRKKQDAAEKWMEIGLTKNVIN